MSGYAANATVIARQLVVSGRVQGVGFRPFVRALAAQLKLVGWVKNSAGQVEIWVQGSSQQVAEFGQRLLADAPVLAQPTQVCSLAVEPLALVGFSIHDSAAGALGNAHIPPDYAVCAACLAELHDRQQRRYHYPFINCTQCGPRYTVIGQLPYDRPATAMAGFPLCPQCLDDYQNIADRRCHAQILACPVCGPHLYFQRLNEADIVGNEAALAAAVKALQQGLIVAVKGVGGYHLLCSALAEPVVARLRQRKHRAYKPFAIMLPWAGEDGLDSVRQYTVANAVAYSLLIAPSRPIVMLQKRPDTGLAAAIAPHLQELGVMLPYSPLHHLLLAALKAPLIASSANISGEPVLTDPEQARSRLNTIADAFLHHNRPILRPADDSVYQVLRGLARPLRLGRGVAPVELELPFRLPRPLLAVGGELKNTVALAWEQRVVISPHIGDLGSPRSLLVFAQTIAELTRLYGVSPRDCACDAHPQYTASRWAQQSGLTVHKVFHHYAHAAALLAEQPDCGQALVFTWDGTGYGADGQLWGGEGLLGKPGNWRRVSSIRAFRLPGGEQAAREPWRTAAALAWEVGEDWPACPVDSRVLKQAWQHQLNSPLSTSVGRLFDAAAAYTGLVCYADFEGHAPMWLENAAAGHSLSGMGIGLALNKSPEGLWVSDWQPLIAMLQDSSLSVAWRSACFHASLALALVAQAQQLRSEHDFVAVGLTGGVFQNRLLTEYVCTLLEQAGFTVLLPTQMPGNDAGLSLGQVLEAGSLMR